MQNSLTSFQGTLTIWLWGRKGLRPNCKVTAPPPFTRRSNHPSSRVSVKPSRGVLVLTRTPISPIPIDVTTCPRTTADRLEQARGLSRLYLSLDWRSVILAKSKVIFSAYVCLKGVMMSPLRLKLCIKTVDWLRGYTKHHC